MRHPAARRILPGPAHLHLVGEARRRKDAEVDVDPVAGLGEELLVAVVPEAPGRPLVAQAIFARSSLDLVVDADEWDRQRHRRNQAEKIEREEADVDGRGEGNVLLRRAVEGDAVVDVAGGPRLDAEPEQEAAIADAIEGRRLLGDGKNKILMNLGDMKTVTQSLTDEEIELIATELNL